jgi:hypothetical protein
LPHGQEARTAVAVVLEHYKVAKKAIWLGTVEAPDKQAAIEKGVQEFKTKAWRLYAVARR